jgi:serine/threonine protein phosphatase 1
MSRTILVGDIHGCYAELCALLDAVALHPDDTLVSVGDLVDRGPQPREVIDLLRGRPNTVVLCGNHERKHIRGLLSFSQQVARLQLGAGYADDVAWMGALPYFYETEVVRAVHFGMFPGVPLAETPQEVLSGTTSGCAILDKRYAGRPWWEHYEDDVPVCFGHAVMQPGALVWRDRVYGLDTGACHGHTLTALILEERRLVSVPASADHWVAVRRRWEGEVLKTQDWSAMTFEQIAKKAGRRRDPEIDGAWFERLSAWSAALAAARPGLVRRLDAELERLRAEHGEEQLGRAAAAHPAASWLLRHQAGRLSREQGGCTTPAEVQRLAAALGEEVPASPM